jgi:hypothetical protein
MLTPTVTEIGHLSSHGPVVRSRVRPARNFCLACTTYQRPADVPWQQHAIGCPVREAALKAALPPQHSAAR